MRSDYELSPPVLCYRGFVVRGGEHEAIAIF